MICICIEKYLHLNAYSMCGELVIFGGFFTCLDILAHTGCDQVAPAAK